MSHHILDCYTGFPKFVLDTLLSFILMHLYNINVLSIFSDSVFLAKELPIMTRLEMMKALSCYRLLKVQRELWHHLLC